MTVEEMLQDVSRRWFLQEPAFYALYCTLRTEANATMECAVRCGQGLLQYNPLLLRRKNLREVEQLLRIELIRIFLGHPYERQPEGCSREAMALGSDCTIADGYAMLHEKMPLQGPGFYHLPLGECYEWYSKEIQKQQTSQSTHDTNRDEDGQRPTGSHRDPKSGPTPAMPESGQEHWVRNTDDGETKVQDGNRNMREDASLTSTTAMESQPMAHPLGYGRADLWRDDSVHRAKMNDLISHITDWGSIPSDVVQQIQASTRARLDRHLVMQGFHSAILAHHRHATRMKPNRRTGFLQMGSVRQWDTRLLVAVDVSRSVDEAVLSDFYSAIMRLFRYGMAQIDTVQFDAALGPVHPLRLASSSVDVKGRGGTNFQPVIDLATGRSRTPYDGLLIFTDGQAPPPAVPPRHLPILWVTPTEADWKAHHQWMDRIGRSCWLS